MRVLFVEAKKKFDKFSKKLKIDINLPRKIHLLYTIQYKILAEQLKKELEKNGYKVLAFQQIVGCSKVKLKASPLFIGSGRFHALSLALSTGKQIFVYEDNKITKMPEQEVSEFRAREQGKLAKFLISDSIGLLVSLKPGQNKLKKVLELKKDLKSRFKGKNFYVFISDTINLQELENFNCDFWVNLACPGVEFDSKRIVNYEKIATL